MLNKKTNSALNRKIIGFTKARKFLFFTIKPKPIYEETGAAQAAPVKQQTAPQAGQQPAQQQQATAAQKQQPSAQQAAAQQSAAAAQKAQPSDAKMPRGSSSGGFSRKYAASKKDLSLALSELGMKISPQDYISQCLRKAAVVAIVVTAILGVIVYMIRIEVLLILVPLIGITVFFMLFNMLANYPIAKLNAMEKDIEKDILFAARDMIISMRSGLPLFNAMATVSTGYGAASKEFAKVVDRIQLGMPIDQAVAEVSSKSKSPTFKRLMLQASTSIKVGADVVNSLQDVISDVSQERVIELRRYGQRLNALAMFYMLFGIIFPSMGLAIMSIMSTFISFFPVNNTTLIFAAVAIAGLQFVFLKMISSSRPSFSM